MPVESRCPNSGALIFTPTAQEKQIAENNVKVKELERQLAEMREQMAKILDKQGNE